MQDQDSILEKLSEFEMTSNFKASRPIFEELDWAMKTIFKQEEQEYKKSKFPDLELHTRVHQECVRTLASFYHNYFETSTNQTSKVKAQIVEYVRLWIKNHQKLDNFAQSYQRVWSYVYEQN